jgi:hypothetical protein
VVVKYYYTDVGQHQRHLFVNLVLNKGRILSSYLVLNYSNSKDKNSLLEADLMYVGVDVV